VVKAVTRHGEATTAPLRDRTTPAAQTVQSWITEVIAKNPQLRVLQSSKQPHGQTPREPKSVFPVQQSKSTAPDSDVVSQSLPRSDTEEPVASPASLPRTPVDEFDPLHFNSWAHPAQFPQQSASNRR